MSQPPITSLPGYPYFYAIPITGFVREGADKRARRASRSYLQDRHSLPPPYTAAPHAGEGLAELDGLNEIPRRIYSDHHRPDEKEQTKRPQSTPPEMTQKGKTSFPPLETKYSWSSYRPQISSPLRASLSSVDSLQELCTIEEQGSDHNNMKSSSRRVPSEMAGEDDHAMGDEERIQVALIESIFLMLHNLQPTYLPRPEKIVSQIVPKPSRKHRLSRQPEVRMSSMLAS